MEIDILEQITPVERRGDIWVKRDDLFCIAGARGGKARMCWVLAQGAKQGLVSACGRKSIQAGIVALIAKHLKIPCRLHYPKAKEFTQEMEFASEHGAELVYHRPGYTSVIVSRAREDAVKRNWTEIPYGLCSPVSVKANAPQVVNLPKQIKRIVIPVGGGVNLSGVLHGLSLYNSALLRVPILGVVVGANPEKTLNLLAPFGWARQVRLISLGSEYHVPVVAALDNIKLDPYYEAKCYSFLEPNDLFWIIGHR